MLCTCMLFIYTYKLKLNQTYFVSNANPYVEIYRYMGPDTLAENNNNNTNDPTTAQFGAGGRWIKYINVVCFNTTQPHWPSFIADVQTREWVRNDTQT